MLRTGKVIIFFAVIIFFNNNLNAQAGFSPYTIKGIGDINSTGLTTNLGMGGIGISNGNGLHLNNMNPALLYKNNLSVFQIGMVGDYKEVSTDELSQTNFDGGFNHIAFGFPVMQDRWSFSIGVMPFTTVNYNITTEETLPGENIAFINTEFQGSGGFSKAYISNGVKLTDNFSVGLKTSFIFGSVKDETITSVFTTEERTIPGTDSTFLVRIPNNQAVFTERTSVTDFSFTTGVAYKGKLKEKTFLNLGFIYGFGGDKDSKQLQSLRNSNFVDTPFANDTIIDARGAVKFPVSYGVGISIEKTLKWTFGADVNLRQWSDFKNFNGDNEGLEDVFEVAVGGEYTPDIGSVDNYLKRVTYRLGFDYQQTPYVFNNEQIDDFGINFGVSLPVRSFSSFNLAFKLGQRGTTDNDLIKEQYFKMYLGVTFNDKWFIRRKFD